MSISKIITALFTLFIFAATSGQAAESFDIDLKELRPARVTKPEVKQPLQKKEPQSLEIDLKELRATKSKPVKSKKNKRKSESKVPIATEEPVPVQPLAEPVKLVIKPVEVPVVSVNATFVEACGLARQVAEKLGLLVFPPTLDLGGQIFTVRYDDVSTTIVCDPTQAEIITYRRLLAMHGDQLLILNSSDSSSRVVQLLAESLGLSFSVTGSNYPQEYLFSGLDPGGQEIKLTIYPAVP